MSEKKNKSKEKEEIIYDKGMVLYSDGGARPHPSAPNGGPGYAGYGIHGYIYSLEPVTKGSGNPNWLITNKGYTLKKNKDQEDKDLQTDQEVKIVKPITYIDSFSSFKNPVTNNVAELVGASSAMDIASRQDIKEFTLYTDSKYVTMGVSEYLPKWKSKNFIREDGSFITNKNEWLDIDKQINKLIDKNINYSVEWIKGHSGNLGNDLADKSATIGVFHSKEDILRSETDYTDAQGYWKTEVDKHPFINNKKLYFVSTREDNTPGQYYMGDHGKDDSFLGKRTSEGCYTYVELNTPDPLIEMVRDKQIKDSNNESIITIIRLDKLFSPSVVNDLNKYGDICLFKPNKIRSDLAFMDADIITRGLKPVRLAMRAITGINELKGVLLAWQNKDPNIIDKSITSDFYEYDKKNVLKLKSDLTSGLDKIRIECFYSKDKKTYPLDLYFGTDLPDRNTLKKIDKLNPQINILTWVESDTDIVCFRYAVVIKVQDAIGIWSSMCSNLKIVK